MRVWKGHGTENDFVVLPDLDGQFELTPQQVARLCDRRAGIGADGVLRVVRSAQDPDSVGMAGDAEYFMDYRNADGSVAEMCGNGIRVFVRYLQAVGLVEQEAAVATRGGIKRVQACSGGFSVEMGQPLVLADRPVATAAPLGPRPAVPVRMPNPHLVVAVGADEQARLDLSSAPAIEPAQPGGANVEFVARLGGRQLRMRVHERGVGETRSCGTGICAAAVAASVADGTERDGSTWRVEVPGGGCTVTWRTDDEVVLAGPAVLVGAVEFTDEWLNGWRAAATMDRDD